MPIFTRQYIAAAVIQARAIDQRNDTDLALQRVADLTHLTPEGVAEIAREEAHTEALAMDAARDISAVGARSLGIAPELAEAPCRGCGACQCNRQPVEAAAC